MKIRIIVIACICLGYIALHILKVQVSPFLLFGMYSKPLEPSLTEEAYLLKTENGFIQPYKLGREVKDVIIGPLDYYLQHQNNEGEDPVKTFVLEKRPHWESSSFFKQISPLVFTDERDLKEFPQWYIKLLSNYMNEELSWVEVYKVKYEFSESGLNQLNQEFVLRFE